MTAADLSPSTTPSLSLWQLTVRERTSAGRWALLALFAVAAWLGAMAYLGPFRPTDISRLLRQVASLDVIYWSVTAVAAGALCAMLALRNRRGAYLAATVLAFILGMRAYGWMEDLYDPRFFLPFRSTEDFAGFAVSRLQWGLAMAVPLLLAWLAFGRDHPLRLGIGDWQVKARDLSAKDTKRSWTFSLFTGYLVIVVLAFVGLQAAAGFAPITTGALWALAPAILGAAVVNAVVEELIFRGFMQPAFIAYGGVGPGLWIQGMMFGLMHWGTSVGVLAALPVSLGIGFGSIIWGKAAYEPADSPG
jgi:membrane protease YdiL (CAAX protease family)